MLLGNVVAKAVSRCYQALYKFLSNHKSSEDETLENFDVQNPFNRVESFVGNGLPLATVRCSMPLLSTSFAFPDRECYIHSFKRFY